MTPTETAVASTANARSTSSPAPASSQPAAARTDRARKTTTVVGFDLGTNKSCVIAGPPNGSDIALGKILPTLVGYVRPGIINGIIPGGAEVLFGEEAEKNRLHVRLVAPLADGVIVHADAARDFMRHARALVDPSGQAELRAVIGVPASATPEAREAIRSAVAGVFERLLLIPEPFLAALGVRDDSRLGQANYADPVTNSLFIDIGAGTSDLCLVQGYFPTASDQISFPFAGDAIDQILREAIDQLYPDNGLSAHKIREIKEAHAYVGPSRKPIDVKIIIGGKSRTLELGDIIGNACNQLLDRIHDGCKRLIARASSDGIEQLLQNIIITGGGSQIRGIDTELQKRLTAENFENPKVRLSGPDFQRYVAIGALKAARNAREQQWQFVAES